MISSKTGELFLQHWHKLCSLIQKCLYTWDGLSKVKGREADGAREKKLVASWSALLSSSYLKHRSMTTTSRLGKDTDTRWQRFNQQHTHISIHIRYLSIIDSPYGLFTWCCQQKRCSLAELRRLLRCCCFFFACWVSAALGGRAGSLAPCCPPVAVGGTTPLKNGEKF